MTAATVAEVTAAIAGRVYQFSTEEDLQAALTAALQAAGLPAEREVRLTAAERIDLLAGDIGIEVKIKGSPAQVLRQLTRYADTGRCSALVLVSTRALHRTLHGKVLNGVPVSVVAPAWM